MADAFFLEWFKPLGDIAKNGSLRVYEEKPGTRDAALQAAASLLIEHYVGAETVLKAGGFEKAAEIIRNSLPTKKRIQSGDLGEILAVEFLHAHTQFRAPILKLRYKSDRDTALHGNDLIALDRSGYKPFKPTQPVQSASVSGAQATAMERPCAPSIRDREASE